MIQLLRTPSGPGIRDDSGVYEGWTVPIDYDPLISKLVAWAPTRRDAMDRMLRALREYRVKGIQTNLNFFMELLNDSEFRDGQFDTGFIEKWMKNRIAPSPPSRVELDLAALGAILAEMKRRVPRNRSRQIPINPRVSGKNGSATGSASLMNIRRSSTVKRLKSRSNAPPPESKRQSEDGNTRWMFPVRPGVFLLNWGTRSIEVSVFPEDNFSISTVCIGSQRFSVEILDGRRMMQRTVRNSDHGGASEIRSPMPGKIVRVLLTAGAEVAAGQGIVVMEAMKMQNEMKSSMSGRIQKIEVVEGETVRSGDLIAIVEAIPGSA